MDDTSWLVLAILVGVLAMSGWIARERWIHQRRRRATHEKERGR